MAEIDRLFQELLQRDGSDLHLAQGQRPTLRVQGHLTPLAHLPLLSRPELCRMLSEICGADRWEKFEKAGDLDFAYALPDGTRFRGNYYRFFFGYGAVFRVIPSRVRTFADLALPESLKKIADLKSGLVLVTGPTGSGKSSTLAALLDLINTKYEKKIITLEEPIEFFHQNNKCVVVHREVGVDTESFAQGLRGPVKADVDIVLVGEMRDRETIELALTAAEMGILVLATLHTNSAVKTMDRIIDVFPSQQKEQFREILANTVQMVVSQTLVRSNDGTRRWAAFEILLRSTALPMLIRSGDTKALKEEINTHAADGMTSMDSSLQRLVKENKVRKEDALLKAGDKSLFT